MLRLVDDCCALWQHESFFGACCCLMKSFFFNFFLNEPKKKRSRRFTNPVSARVFGSWMDVELADSDCPVKMSIVEFNCTQIRGI